MVWGGRREEGSGWGTHVYLWWIHFYFFSLKHGGCDRPHRSKAERSYPSPKVRGGGQEEEPQVQGSVAARVQEGLEKLFHVQGQEGQR